MRAGDRLARHRRAVDMGDPHIRQAGLGEGATLPQGDDVAGGGLAFHGLLLRSDIIYLNARFSTRRRSACDSFEMRARTLMAWRRSSSARNFALGFALGWGLAPQSQLGQSLGVEIVDMQSHHFTSSVPPHPVGQSKITMSAMADQLARNLKPQQMSSHSTFTMRVVCFLRWLASILECGKSPSSAWIALSFSVSSSPASVEVILPVSPTSNAMSRNALPWPLAQSSIAWISSWVSVPAPARCRPRSAR